MANQVPAPVKEPSLFKPGAKIFLGILTVLSAGYFSGAFIGSLRRAQNTVGYVVTLLLGAWIFWALDAGTSWYVIWGGATLANALFTRSVIPPALEYSSTDLVVRGDVMNQPFKLDAADGSGSGLQYFMKAKSQVEAIKRDQANRGEALRNFYGYLQQFESDFPVLELGADPKAEINLFTSEDCILSEPRKGPSVTERDTRTGIRPFVGTKVGPFFVGGAGPQKSHSTSVTTPGQDVVQPVDQGQVVVTTRGISFVGEKYTRHSDFKTIIANDGEHSQLTIADSKKSTNWTIIFSDIAHMWISAALIDAASSLSERKLDTSGKATFNEIQQAIATQRDGFAEQLKTAYQEAYEQFEFANDQLREYHRVYPNQVPDPGPREIPAHTAHSSEAISPPN